MAGGVAEPWVQGCSAAGEGMRGAFFLLQVSVPLNLHYHLGQRWRPVLLEGNCVRSRKVEWEKHTGLLGML